MKCLELYVKYAADMKLEENFSNNFYCTSYIFRTKFHGNMKHEGGRI